MYILVLQNLPQQRLYLASAVIMPCLSSNYALPQQRLCLASAAVILCLSSSDTILMIRARAHRAHVSACKGTKNFWIMQIYLLFS